MVHMAFLSPDWMMQIGAFSSQFTIPLEGTTLYDGTDGLLCSWISIPCDLRHQIQPYAGYLHPLSPSASLSVLYTASLSFMSTSSATLSLSWLFGEACREWVFWVLHGATNRLPTYTLYPSSSCATTHWPCCLLHPVTLAIFISECRAVSLLLLHSVFPGIEVPLAKLSCSCHIAKEVQSCHSFFSDFRIHRLESNIEN